MGVVIMYTLSFEYHIQGILWIVVRILIFFSYHIAPLKCQYYSALIVRVLWKIGFANTLTHILIYVCVVWIWENKPELLKLMCNVTYVSAEGY